MVEEPYPHSRDDCDGCGEFDADMAAHYDGLTGHDPRWCHRCAGQLLTRLVLTGQTVSIYPLGGPVATSVADDTPCCGRSISPSRRYVSPCRPDWCSCALSSTKAERRRLHDSRT